MNHVPTVVIRPDVVAAWRAAAELLVNEGPRFNLVAHSESIATPTKENLELYDPSQLKPVVPVLDVANTIFPAERHWRPGDRPGFYARYSRVYERGKNRKPTAWGTYFQRLIEFGPTKVNQVERVVAALSDWGKRPHAALVVHVSASTLDKPKPLGAPCWQYGQFNVEDGQVSLTAVYRSQDYFQKALGNFVGLSRLLRFVCSESGTTPGSLTCMATFAQLGGQRTATRNLLAQT